MTPSDHVSRDGWAVGVGVGVCVCVCVCVDVFVLLSGCACASRDCSNIAVDDDGDDGSGGDMF